MEAIPAALEAIGNTAASVGTAAAETAPAVAQGAYDTIASSAPGVIDGLNTAGKVAGSANDIYKAKKTIAGTDLKDPISIAKSMGAVSDSAPKVKSAYDEYMKAFGGQPSGGQSSGGQQ